MEPPNLQGSWPLVDNPRLIGRLIDAIAQGVRSTRGLQEALGIDVRAVQANIYAAQWLGLLLTDGEVQLSPAGLELAYAGKHRSRVYSSIIRSHPFVSELLHGRFEPPFADDIAQRIARLDPELPPQQINARAGSILSLITPAIGRTRLKTFEEPQLELPLTVKPTSPEQPRLALHAGRDYNPDVYRFVLCALLDHGELSLGQIRALLDRAQVMEAPLGGYVDLALARGDAVRFNERLVATRTAVMQRDLADTTSSIALSDLSYRAYLGELKAAATGDRQAEIRIDRVRARFRIWDRRLFGHDVDPQHIEAELRRVLMDRSLDAFPIAKGPGITPIPIQEPFLDAWNQPGLAIALPPTLAALRHGLDHVNQALKHARQQAQDVALPDIAHRPALYHAGILHPGEPLPKWISDVRSLRLRLLTHSPYPAIATAFLLLHRAFPQRFELSLHRGGYHICVDGSSIGDLLTVIDGFSWSKFWLPCRRRISTLKSTALIQVLESLGIVTRVGSRAVLAERLFVQLRTEADETEVFRRLQGLAESLHGWMESQSRDLPKPNDDILKE